MKKLLFSGALIIVFFVYTVYERASGAQSVMPTPAPLPPVSQTIPKPQKNVTGYREGEYVGDVTDAYYGNMQVKVVIKGQKISDVQFLQYPNDRPTSVAINTQAMPLLKSETIHTQNANVDIVSGATQTSEAFIASLDSALKKAL